MTELICCSGSAIGRPVSESQGLRLPAVLFANNERVVVGWADFKTRGGDTEATRRIDGITSVWDVLVQSQVTEIVEDD